jgi:hypothetical protein
MDNFNSIVELRNAIEALEEEHRNHKELLVSQMHKTYRSINPFTFIKDTIKDAVTSPNNIENTLVGGISLAAGVLTRRIIVGRSSGIVRKLIGSGVQFGITSAIAQNGHLFKNVGKSLFRLFSSDQPEKT